MTVPVTRIAPIALLLMVVLFVIWQPAAAFDVFYVSVGNSRYRDASLNIPDANLSAREVARTLHRAGAVDGVTLLSRQGAYVTPKDVEVAVDDVINRARRADQPLIIYYFIGHGRSDGGTTQHVSVTGNREHAGGKEALLATESLRKKLSQSRIPYILLMDNCFWRESLDFIGPVGVMGFASVPGDALVGLSGGIGENLLSLGARVENIAIGSGSGSTTLPRIEIYAAGEGKETVPLEHPTSSRHVIGPLARRLLLLLGEASENRVALSVPGFVTRMQDKSFDPVSIAGHVIEIAGGGTPVLFPVGGPAEVDDLLDIRHGSDR